MEKTVLGLLFHNIGGSKGAPGRRLLGPFLKKKV